MNVVKKNCKYLETCRGGCSASTLLIKGSLDSVSPYCPLEHEEIGQFADPGLQIHYTENDIVRVHENYLCTWIGDVKDQQ